MANKSGKDFSVLSTIVTGSQSAKGAKGALGAVIAPRATSAPATNPKTKKSSAPIEPVAPSKAKLIKHGYVVKESRHKEMVAIAYYKRAKIQDIIEEAFALYVEKIKIENDGKIPFME